MSTRAWRGALPLLALGMVAMAGLSGCSSAGRAQDPAPVTASATVREKVVLIHGLGRSRWAMQPLANRLEEAGYAVTLVGYNSLGATPAQAVAQTTAQIDACCAASDMPVHFVGHSLGGLLIRAYLAENAMPRLGRVVMLGTPNHGTPVVDQNRGAWWMQMAGPLANALGTGTGSFAASLPPPSYPVGVIAGRVAKRSNAVATLSGPHDGLVPVASTRIAGMQDFAVLDVGHSMMRRDERVARHTVSFLRSGHF